MTWRPKQSLWASPPKRKYHRNALDSLVHQTYWVPESAHANIQGRRIQPRAERFLPFETKLPAPIHPEPTALLRSLPLELPLYIDSSMLALWRSCKRKHFWSTLSGLYPSGKSVHLVAGGAIASGMEAARRYCFSQPEPSQVGHQRLLEAAYPAYNREWGDYDPPDNPRNAKTFAGSFQALANYLETYHPGRDPVQPMLRADGSPAVEYRFAIPLPVEHPSGEPFLFVGRFDLLGSYNQSFMVVLDEKTTQSFSASWIDSWNLRGQFIGYVWALRQQGYDINSAVARGIAIQKTQYDTRSALIQYPNHLISRWETQMLREVEAIKASWLEYQSRTARGDVEALDRAYPYDFYNACDAYGGCAYSTLCQAHNPYDFTSNYIPFRWNPLAKQPVEELTDG